MRKMVLPGLLLCSCLTGCAETDVIVQRQTQMEGRIEHLVQAKQELAAKDGQLASDLLALRKRIDELSVQLEEVRGAAPGLPGKPAGPSRIELISQDKSPEKDAAQAEAYMKAFGLYSANDYTGAIEAFSGFIKSWPDSDYAGNAQYWIGECYYTRSDLPRALAAFTTVVESYPKGIKVPDAMLKGAYTLQAMKETEKGKAMLEALIARYPNSPAAAKARERLENR